MTTVRVLGCSDAFSSGGRLFPAFLVQSRSATFLIDCGPTVLVGMKRLGLDADMLDAVLISHFHGDHFGGMPFLEIELAIMRRRKRALLVGGPPGVEDRVHTLINACYPALTPGQRITYEFSEWHETEPVTIGPVRVTASPVVHTPEARPYALRIEIDGRTIAYSGDTEWTDALIPLAAGADLFICEATTFSAPVPNHVSYEALMQHRDRFSYRRMLVTHMSDEMLAQLPVEGADAAEDGLLIEL
jgi:ribonuclease BN (tRNA processing enzyme)